VWTVNSGANGETSDTLNSAATAKDDVIVVVVTPNDGTQDGQTATDSVTVINTPPTAPVIQVLPQTPAAGVDDLVCSVVTPSIDADNDGVTYSFAWTVDTAAFGAAVTTTETGDTVPAASTGDDEEWQCTVTPNDTDDDGPTASVTVSTPLPPNLVDYARLQFPCSATVAASAMLLVYGVVHETGVTEGAGAGAGIRAEFGFGPADSDPDGNGAWTWQPAAYNTDVGNDDEYSLNAVMPAQVGSYDFAFRFSLDAGTTWVYADRGDDDPNPGSCSDGYEGTVDGYQPANAGKLTVQ